jgi:hypothetical protein
MQVFHAQSSKDIIYQRAPIRISNFTDPKTHALTLALTFLVKDDVKEGPKVFKLAINLNQTYDSSGKQFTLAPGVRLPNFIFEGVTT